MARFTSFIELAQRLIKKNGRTVTLTFRSTLDADPLRPFEGKTTSTDTTSLKAAFFEFDRQDFMAKNNGLPINIQLGDKRCFIAAGDLPTGKIIDTGTVITDRNVKWKIENVRLVDPGDDPILYDLQVRA